VCRLSSAGVSYGHGRRTRTRRIRERERARERKRKRERETLTRPGANQGHGKKPWWAEQSHTETYSAACALPTSAVMRSQQPLLPTAVTLNRGTFGDLPLTRYGSYALPTSGSAALHSHALIFQVALSSLEKFTSNFLNLKV
jgi:hypothetical protein